MSLATVLNEVVRERRSQDAKWGEQNHPDGTGPNYPWHLVGTAEQIRERMRAACDQEHREGNGTWVSIALEEFAEAVAEDNPRELRKELVQVAAVFVAWIESIDRNQSYKKG